MSGKINLVASPHPFLTQRVDLLVEAGGSLADVLDRSGLPFPRAIDARICINDLVIPKEDWETVVPGAGDVITLRAIPRGGGGGKNVLRIVMTIALIAAMPYAGAMLGNAMAMGGTGLMTAGSMSLGGAVLLGQGALLTGGMALINAICPPQQPSIRSNDGTDTSQSYGIEGAQNQISPWNPIPVILGRHRVTPPYAAKPYTEINGDDQYLHALFCVGYGPLDISDPKIGDTDLADFQVGETPEDRLAFRVWPEFNPDTQTLEYFRDNCTETALSIELKQTDGYHTRTTEAGIDEIGVDITAPQGMVEFDSDGDKLQRTVGFLIEYKKTTDTEWSTSKGGQTFSTRNSGTILFPSPYVSNIGNYEDGYVESSSTGYAYVIVGMDKTSGAIRLYFRKSREIPGLDQIQSYSTANAAKKNCPRPPSHVAPLAGIALNSTMTTITNAAIDNTSWRALDEVDCANASDFLVSATATPGATVNVAGGTLYFCPQFIGADNNAIRRTFRFAVENGTYDVRVCRDTADSTSDKVFDGIYWTCLRSFKCSTPITKAGLALVEMRVKATDQLNGMISNFNCIAQSILPDWNPVSSSWEQRKTSNPASLFRAVFQGAANKKPAPDSALNLVDLQAWHEFCTAKGFTYNQPVDYQGTVREIAGNIAAAGRASLAMRDGKYTIIQDVPRLVIAQHFTPHNSWGFKSNKNMLQLPHGFRVRFADEDADWQSAERIVYADGYNASNATVFEELQLPGVTDSELAWAHGRFHLAQLILRPEEYQFQTDIENLVCTRGDLIRLNHDVPMWGLGSGRIKSVGPDYVLNGEFGRFSLAPTDLQPDFWVIRKTNGGNVGTASPYLASGNGQGVELTAGASTYTFLQTWLASGEIGPNLIKNGTFEYKNADNFTMDYCDVSYAESETFSGAGCLRMISAAAGRVLLSNEYVPITDTSKAWMVGAAIKTTLPTSTSYCGVVCYDEDQVEISTQRSWRYPNRNTTLYAPLSAGATYVDVVPAAEMWEGGSYNYFIQLGIAIDGSDLPVPSASMLAFSTAPIDTSDPNYWRCPLYSAYSGPTYAAGTNVGQSLATGGYNYSGHAGAVCGTGWNFNWGVISGMSDLYEYPLAHRLRYGTKYIRFISMPSYNQADTTYIDNIIVRQVDNPTASLIGQTVTFGAWVWSAAASNARLYIADNVGGVYSGYHPGNGAWQWITVSRTIPAGAYKIQVHVVSTIDGAPSRFRGGIVTTGLETITLDETMTMESSKAYGLRVRKHDGSSVTLPVNTVAGDTNTLTLATPLACTAVFPPAKGDLVMFGQSGTESVELLVKGIQPGPDLTATITAVDYSPAVYNADTGPIPAFDPGITLPPAPQAPLIVNCRSNEFVMVRQKNGNWVVRMLVNLAHPSNTRMHDVERVEGQYRLHATTGSGGTWIKLAQIPKDAVEVSIYSVETGKTYEIRFRYVFKTGNTGPWTSYYQHTVIGKSGNPSDVSFDDSNCVFQSHRITFRWLAILDPDLDFYELRTDTNWGQAAGMVARTKAIKYVYSHPLDINATYYIKACDTSGNYSTNADEITGDTDYLTLGTITTDFSTENLQISWPGVDPGKLSYYTVALYNDSDMAGEHCVHTSNQFTNPHYEFTLAMNKLAAGGPYRELWVRVTAHDIYGRTGYSDGYGINAAPPIITTLIGVPGINSMTTVCDPLFDDIIGYEFACDTDTPPTDTQVVGTNFVYWEGLTGGTAHYIRARAKDVFGYGEWSTIQSVTPLAMTIDETDVDMPMLRDATWTCDAGTLSWNAHKIVRRGTSYDIAAGNTTNAFVYWNSGSPTTYSTGATVPITEGTWVVCYQSGNVAYPAVQAPLVIAGLIQANTITLSKLIGSGSLSIGSGGSLAIASGGALTMSGGTVSMTGGSFSISGGTVSISSGSTFNVSASAGITVAAGGALKLAGDAAGPGILQVYKSGTSGVYMAIGGVTGQGFRVIPSTANAESLFFAVDSQRWANIYGYASSWIQWFSSDGLGLYSYGSTGMLLYASTGYLTLQSANGVKIIGNLRSDSSTNISRIYRGSYSGNGATSQRTITSSLGFTPKLVIVAKITANGGTSYTFMAGDMFDGSGYSYSFSHGSSAVYCHFNPTNVNIITGGFAVAYGCTWWPNEDGVTYEYWCLG